MKKVLAAGKDIVSGIRRLERQILSEACNSKEICSKVDNRNYLGTYLDRSIMQGRKRICAVQMLCADAVAGCVSSWQRSVSSAGKFKRPLLST